VPTTLDNELLAVVVGHSTLCLNVGNPGWEDARGYTVDPESLTMYFPVSKKYLDGRDLDAYSVLIWSNPRVIATGRLSSAANEADAASQYRALVSRGWEPDKAAYSLYDARSHKPRKNRFKLLISSLRRPELRDVRTRDARRVLGPA